MHRSTKRYVDKLEALDFAAGTYNAHTLKRERYNQRDFLEYLSTYEMLEADPTFLEVSWE